MASDKNSEFTVDDVSIRVRKLKEPERWLNTPYKEIPEDAFGGDWQDYDFSVSEAEIASWTVSS